MANTIAALASGRPPAAIAVIRLSGPSAFAALSGLLGGPLPTPRRLSLRRLHDPVTAELLDQAMVVCFPGPDTASGEDLAELHLHGGVAVIDAVLGALLAHPDVRLAEPGEFTRRAFANGRLDLAEVEGIADLVAAETTAQRRQALSLAGGALSRAAEAWRSECLAVLAQAEAGLDFAEDEADVAQRLDEAARETLLAMADRLALLLVDSARAAQVLNGLTIAVTGAPNVGKSSLVNALAMCEAAIVTPLAGTTRDPIAVPIVLDGVGALLIDTAGLRDTVDVIEAEGIRRARIRAAAADLVITVVVPGEQTEPEVDGLVVVNKIDTHGPASLPSKALSVSALRGDGVAELRAWLTDWAKQLVRPGEPALLVNARHRAAFADAALSLRAAAEASDPVLRAECLRTAAHAFGRVAGRVDVDDVLDRIFSQFCVGK
ncbi:tRNA uridine-5-carboxymethylaminomethyl(34) synthesis GTPase MnmE [Sandarakinorhabdus sp.]|uniref:tRNA uridine-5-carboxymethylaminomethyl(34) synthesis GTPase MnmE n=1 Tax=Sandarakinorhabdus sp. TaxID=1916663 RepID=UPI00286E5A01|nr:tRNA uridine-5-carboxymethylaminomethyl(34) synthesis GTPase MnmE [Sandarakinorhabdus sp.]